MTMDAVMDEVRAADAMAAYVANTVRLGDRVARWVMVEVDRAALRLRADDEVVAVSYSDTMAALCGWLDAHPYGTDSDPEVSVSLVRAMAFRVTDRRATDAHRAARALRVVEVGSLDALSSVECDALEARLWNAGHDAASMATAPDAESNGSGHRAPMALSLVEAYGAAAAAGHGGAVAIVQAVTSDAWARRHRDVVRGKGEAADIASNMTRDALHFRRAGGVSAALSFLPLRVSVVAAAAGCARPRTAAASALLREAAYSAAGVVFSFMAPWLSVDVHTDAVRAYCGQERRAFGGRGQAVWQRDARPEWAVAPVVEVKDSTGALVRAARAGVRLYGWQYVGRSSFTPDLDSWRLVDGVRVRTSVLAPFQPITATRANVSGKGRKGATAGQVGLGVGYGGQGVQWSPGPRAAWAGEVEQTRDALTARAASRADDAATAHGDAADSRARGSVCGRVVVTPEGALCGCSAARGLALVLAPVAAPAARVGVAPAVVDAGALSPEGVVVGWVLVHPLAVCAAPEVGRGGVLRCGCGARRGLLSEAGGHRRRVVAGRSMV